MNQFFGIDVSKWQGNFDFKNAMKQGVKFAILRGGFTGSSDGMSKAKDGKFETYYKQCKKLGLPVGCYWFSRATSKRNGELEAKYMYENCLKGKQFEYPIYIDVEDSKYQKKASKKAVTDAIIGFCEYLENKGFYVGIYASDISGFKEMMNIKDLKAYDKWVARYGTKPKYVDKYGMWQFTSKNGKIKNASSNLDLDYSYKDYPKIIKSKGLNGYKKQSEYLPQVSNEFTSIVDALKSINLPSDLEFRKLLAHKNNIDITDNYKMNIELLELLKFGKLKKI